jgi:hypothetical protein
MVEADGLAAAIQVAAIQVAVIRAVAADAVHAAAKAIRIAKKCKAW